MKKLRVFGHTEVTVSVLIEVGDDEELTEEEIYDRARENFGGIMAFAAQTSSLVSATMTRPYPPTRSRSSTTTWRSEAAWNRLTCFR